MAKKRRKRKRHNKRHTVRQKPAKAPQPTPNDEFDDVLYGPGFVMARKGRFILTDTSRTEEEHRALLRGLAEQKDELSASIETQVEELETILSQYNPFDIIGNIWFANTITDPETYKEYEHEGSLALVEYLALLYLTKPYHESAECLIPGPVLEDINNRIQSLFRDTIFYLAVKDLDPSQLGPRDFLDELRFKTLTGSLIVRYPAYPHHLERTIEGIFGPLSDQLESVLGFNIDDALAFAHAIEEMLSQRLNDRSDQARNAEHRFRKEVNRYRQKQPAEDSELSTEILEYLAGMDPSEAKQEIQNLVTGWTFFALGDTWSFTAEELAKETSRDIERIKAYLKSLSLEFGAVDSRYRIPSPTHPLTTHPLIHQGGRYFCPVPNSLVWSIRPALESYLNPESPQAASGTNAAIWERYQKARSDYLEARSLELLESALRHAEAYRNLKYDVVDDDGKVVEMELDGLLILDSVLFLVEDKAGTMSLPARRGAPKRMVTEIRELIGEAYDQALRARRYIKTTDKPMFRLNDGGAFEIPKKRIDRVFMVTITLEALDAFVTNLYQLEDLGLFAKGDLPWTVSLFDLEVIADLVEFPSQFIHYLRRRHRLNQIKRVFAYEELDWFGHYLQEGLYFEHIFDEGGLDFYSLLSYTTIFDDYYLHVLGYRTTPAPKPSQPMPDIMRQILRELENIHPSGYVDAACALLNMGSDSRELFAKSAQERRGLTIKDGRTHDFTLGFTEAGFGVTYMFELSKDSPELCQRLRDYCLMKKYQTRSSLWVGIGCIADEKGWAHMGVVLKEPWEYDEEMEKLIAQAFPSRSGA
jgi:hypothetical protein